MMIEKVKIMYDLMVEKFESSPHGRHQAKAYRSIRALADECDSVAEMTVRLQNEGYNKLPGIALITDKVEAHHRAATDNGLEEHAAIYRRVLDDIDANPDNAYMTGFYDDVKQANMRYAKTVERLLACFNDYLHFRIKNEVPPNVGVALGEWRKEGRDFEDVVFQKAFRSYFACSDKFLESFAREFEMLSAGRLQGMPTAESGEIDEAFNAIKQDEARRRSVAKTELLRYRSASAMSVAPATAEGDYEYIEIEVRS